MKPSCLIQLSESCRRAANLELDFDDPARLRDIYVSSKFQEGLEEILSSVLETDSNRRVRVLSGSPGLGKSSFALFAAQTVSKKHPQIISEKLKKARKTLQERFKKFQHSRQTKLLPVFINGYEGNIEETFVNKLRRALSRCGLSVKHSKNGLEFYRRSVKCLGEKGYGGVFVVYDEFGKYLERAVHNPDGLNIQFLQNFAEFCDRSGAAQCHLTLVTHLSISQYAGSLPFHVQREWAKIEGRFQETAFYDKNFDCYKMIAAVFRKNIAQTAPAAARKYKFYIKKYRSALPPGAFGGFMDSEEAEKILLDCFPLHPAVLSFLPCLSMKIAQNERTLYTFLTHDEPHSLKRFLIERFQNEKTLVAPHDLYQYFRPLIGKDVGAGGSYKIQLTADEALGQIERQDEVSKQIISLAALGAVIKNPRFAPLTEEFLSACFNRTFSKTEIKKSLKELKREKIFFYNKKTGRYLLQSGSPINIDEEIARLKTVSLTSKRSVQILKKYFRTNFIVPKKYNFDHAVTRFYRTEAVSVEELKKIKTNRTVDFHKEDGLVFYVIPFSRDEQVYAKSEIQKITAPLVVFVLPKKFIECKKDLEELNAVDRLYHNKEILSAGPLARKELDRHKNILLSSLRSLLKPLVGEGDLSAEAVYPKNSSVTGEPAPFRDISSFKELQRFAGDLFNREYSKYIRFNLEYMNRRRVSGAVALGRKQFIDSLISRKNRRPTKENTALLRKKQGPSEAIFKTMKKLSRFRFNERENIYKVSPKSEFQRFFTDYQKILSDRPQGVRGSELLDILTAPPYGLRQGVVPVFAALADLCLKQPVSCYFDSAYVKDLDGDHYDLMMKYPKKTVIHCTPIDGARQRFLDGLSEIFGAESGSVRSVLKAALKWRKTVPESAKKSSVLSSEGRKFLIQTDSSQKPDQLLFNKLPECFGHPAVGPGISADQTEKTLSLAKKTKKEIDGVYRNLLLKIKSDLSDFMEWTARLTGLPAGLPPVKKSDGPASRFQYVLSKIKHYPLSAEAARFMGRALNFDASNHYQYFLETIADVLTGSSPRYWDGSGYAKFEFALKKIKAEIEAACEIAHPDFKGQSVAVFIDRGTDRKTVLKLGALPGAAAFSSPAIRNKASGDGRGERPHRGGPHRGGAHRGGRRCGGSAGPKSLSGGKGNAGKQAERLALVAERIKSALASFDETDKRKIMLTVLESLDRSSEESFFEENTGPETHV